VRSGTGGSCMFLDWSDKELRKASVSITTSDFPHGIFRLPLYRY